MKLTVPKLEISPTDGFSDQIDIFHRRDFGERLANLIENSAGDLVIALDANWGEGKSTFIKMWQGHVENHRDNKFKVFYFDAFKNDYQKDPFLALVAEIFQLLDDKTGTEKQEFVEQAKKVAKALFRGSLKLAAKTATVGLLDGKVIDGLEKDIGELVTEEIDLVINQKLENANQDKRALDEFSQYLKEITAKYAEPVVFIIDELDRCRPDFSLELIEQIKHLFTVPGITFLLVLNREQLEEAVKTHYGLTGRASKYLQKFVNLWISLPRKYSTDLYDNADDGANYVKYIINKLLDDGENYKDSDALYLLSELVKYLKVSFREIEQILTYFALLNNMSKQKPTYKPQYQLLYAYACLLKVMNPSIFKELATGSIDYGSLIQKTGLSQLNEHTQISLFKTLLKFDLSDKETQDKMIDNEEVSRFELIHHPSGMAKKVCSWLEEIQAP